MGAVVLGELSTFQTPLSGQISPVRAFVPSGARLVAVRVMFLRTFALPGLPGEASSPGPTAGWLAERHGPAPAFNGSIEARKADR